jgi:hypothetical protein
MRRRRWGCIKYGRDVWNDGMRFLCAGILRQARRRGTITLQICRLCRVAPVLMRSRDRMGWTVDMAHTIRCPWKRTWRIKMVCVRLEWYRVRLVWARMI